MHTQSLLHYHMSAQHPRVGANPSSDLDFGCILHGCDAIAETKSVQTNTWQSTQSCFCGSSRYNRCLQDHAMMTHTHTHSQGVYNSSHASAAGNECLCPSSTLIIRTQLIKISQFSSQVWMCICSKEGLVKWVPANTTFLLYFKIFSNSGHFHSGVFMHKLKTLLF